MKRVEAYASIITYTQVESLFYTHTYIDDDEMTIKRDRMNEEPWWEVS